MSRPTANAVIHGARIFDGMELLNADAVAIADGTIVAMGAAEEILAAHARLGIVTIDAGGALLTPGFIDAHVHTVFAGMERLGCDLSEAEGSHEALAVIAAYVHGPAGAVEWIRGGGWTMSDFPGGAPLATDLDAIVADRAVFLMNRDHHSAWVNSLALQRAGITAATQDPAGGRIERDAAGNPTGTLHEAALDMVADLLPEETPEEFRAGLLEGQRYLHSMGITGWQDAILGNYSGHADPYDTYRDADAAGELSADVVGALWWPRDVTDIPAQVRSLVARSQERGTKFRATAVKFMLDGVIESQTAAMAEPYHSCGCPGADTGLNYFAPDFLTAAITAVDAAGLDVHLHAIGDRAVTHGLDAFAAARRANPGSTGRHHIAHLQVVDPDDIPRFAELGITANMQALWACNDEAMLELTVPVLGKERSGWQYPFKALLDAGAPLAMGSDWPVSTPDPWQGIHTAVTRTEAGGDGSDPALNPDQGLGLIDALRAYTSGSARLNRVDAAGRIAVGTTANLALADRDPFNAPLGELHSVTNRLTIADGRIVHDSATSMTHHTEGAA
ncbi:amidohydrolase [Paeniglutamicibacter antarcticus]|uniref:Amidohydrolase n=1 Tax=Paeniglutamicibacter antarcticus TaxID=494023 RepID=A0ABP9TQG5_9MICC